ncbi:MAG: lysophospholipid acyltransferase family protein [Fidelibacterota bacterium]
MTWTAKITYYCLRFIARNLGAKSKQARLKVAQLLASFVYHYIPIRKKQAEINLQKAFPQKPPFWINRILKRCYILFCSNFIEFITLPKSIEDTTIKVHGQKVLEKAFKQGKGVILITAHFGMWEILVYWLGVNGYPCYGIIQRQRNRGADLFFREIRSKSQVHQLYKNTPVETMHKVLKKGGVLVLASDQDARKKGVFVKFFNQLSSTPKGAAIFHLRTKAPAVFATAYKNNTDDLTLHFQSVIAETAKSVRNFTQAYTAMLEQMVREYPDHYFWFHRKWKTKAPSI